jgi:hypothetical protein
MKLFDDNVSPEDFTNGESVIDDFGIKYIASDV